MSKIYIIKQFGFCITLLILLTSCVNEEKYYGDWVLYDFPDDSPPLKIKIDKDSIHLFTTISDASTSYPLKFKNKGLSFMGYDFKTSVKTDTLLHFQNNIYYKNNYVPEEIVEINYPNILGFEFIKQNLSRSTIVFYGKKKNSNEYSLQLNDKYASFNELMPYLLPHHPHNNLPELILYCDKNAPMKDLEGIFTSLRWINMLKISLVNGIDYSIGSDSSSINNLQYVLNLQTIKLMPLTPYTNEDYYIEILGSPLPAPFLPTNFKSQHYRKHDYFFLIENEFYSGKEKVTREGLIKQCEKLILNNELGIFLYDGESSYNKFIEFTMCYQGTLNKFRNEEALKLENGSFEYSTIENQIKIAEKFPDISINGYSIELFRLIEKDKDSLNIRELTFDNLNSKIPDFYLEKKQVDL